MYKYCVTEQSARRQRELENGLLQAMCSRKYEDISISELCQQIGVPILPGTFGYRFKT